MGYYIYANGELTFKDGLDPKVIKETVSFLKSKYFELNMSEEQIIEYLHTYIDYEGSMLTDTTSILKTIEPYLEEGSLYFVGEGREDLWGYEIKEDGCWHYMASEIIYKDKGLI